MGLVSGTVLNELSRHLDFLHSNLLALFLRSSKNPYPIHGNVCVVYVKVEVATAAARSETAGSILCPLL